MKDYVGLPASMFADRELMGARVRLLVCVAVGPGMALHRGECFRVVGTQITPGQRGRCLLVTNARAKRIPVSDHSCELLLEWPESVRGHHDGK